MISKKDIRRTQMYFLFVFLILVVIIGAGGRAYLAREIEGIKKVQRNELLAVAELKADQIVKWREERLGDAEAIYYNVPLIRSIEQLFRGEAEDVALKEEITRWMEALQEYYHYKDILLLNPGREIILSVLGGGKETCTLPDAFIATTQYSGKIAISDLYKCEDNSIAIDTIIPLILPGENNNEAIGIILLRVDPNQFLYPLIQAWPMPSRTSETLLVRQEGEKVAFLNELRHRKNTALLLQISLSEQEVPAVMAVSGKEEFREGLDYRGVLVFAAIKKIQDSPWFLIAKVDKDEIYEPVRREIIFVTALLCLLFIVSVLSLGFLWQLEVSRFYRGQHEMESQRTRMEEKLKEANEEWEKTFNATSDLIFILGKDNTIIKLNKSLAEFLKAKPEDIVGKKCYEVLHKMTTPWPNCPFQKTLIDKKPHISEVNDPKMGHFLLISISPMFDDRGEISGAVHIAKDITGLKRTEEELKKKIYDLERFQKVTLDRELKMKELKAEIERLRSGTGK